MAEIPLAQDDKGNVIGFDGERWRAPDDIAKDASGKRAFRFGQTWQIEPDKAQRNVAPAATPAEDEFGNTAAIAAAGAAKGLRSGLDPRGPAMLGMRLFPPLQSALEMVGADKAVADLKAADPINYVRQMPGVGRFMPSPELAETYSDQNKTAKALGAEMTPVRKMLSTGAEIFGSAVPMMVNPAMAGYAAAGALTGALGEQLGAHVEGVGPEAGKIAGSMLPALVSPGIALARRGAGLAKDMTAPFTDKGLQGMADRAVLEASGQTPQQLAASLKPPALASQPATLGQRTANRGLLDAEYALHGKTPLIEDSYRTTARLAGDEMKALAGTTERSGSEALRGALSSVYQKEKAMVTPAIDRVKEGLKSINAKGDALANYVDSYAGNLSQARRKWLADAGLGDLKKLAESKSVALNEIDDVLAGMKAAVRDMPAGTPQKLEVGKFVSHMQQGMEKIVPDMGPAYRQYAQFKADFDSNKLIGKLFARNTDRTFKIPASEIGDTLRRMPAEAIERAASTSPGVKRAMRDYIAAAWQESSTTANAATRASGAPSFASALKFRQDNDAIFRAAFSKDDLARADKIMKALEAPTLPEFGQRRFGSPTYNKFQKATLIEGIVGKWLGNIPGGGMINQALGNFVFSKPIAQLEQKIAEALLSPDQTVARLLTMKATPANVRLFSSYLSPRPLAPVAISAIGAAREDRVQ